MHKNPALILRILSSSVCISEKAGSIIREIIRKGNLNTIDKVCIVNVLMTFFLKKFFFAFQRDLMIYKLKLIEVQKNVL